MSSLFRDRTSGLFLDKRTISSHILNLSVWIRNDIILIITSTHYNKSYILFYIKSDVVRLPRPIEKGKRCYSSFQICTELPVPPQAAGVVGTFNCCVFYHSGILNTTVSVWSSRMSYY